MLASQEQFPRHKFTPLTLKKQSNCTEGAEDDAWKMTSDRSEHKAVKFGSSLGAPGCPCTPAAFVQPDRRACSIALMKLV